MKNLKVFEEFKEEDLKDLLDDLYKAGHTEEWKARFDHKIKTNKSWPTRKSVEEWIESIAKEENGVTFHPKTGKFGYEYKYKAYVNPEDGATYLDADIIKIN